MSAYVVDREHIIYLVKAATSRRIGYDASFSYYHDGQSHRWHHGDTNDQLRVANMLWMENVKSVMHRYPDSTEDDLPGTIGEIYVIGEKDLRLAWETFDPVQVLKSCHCFAYQSCEHQEWDKSEAKAFIDALTHSAQCRLPGYDDAEWGTPALLYGAIAKAEPG